MPKKKVSKMPVVKAPPEEEKAAMSKPKKEAEEIKKLEPPQPIVIAEPAKEEKPVPVTHIKVKCVCTVTRGGFAHNSGSILVLPVATAQRLLADGAVVSI